MAPWGFTCSRRCSQCDQASRSIICNGHEMECQRGQGQGLNLSAPEPSYKIELEELPRKSQEPCRVAHESISSTLSVRSGPSGS